MKRYITSLWTGDFEMEPRETILYYYGKNNLNAVRKGTWKLVLPHTWWLTKTSLIYTVIY